MSPEKHRLYRTKDVMESVLGCQFSKKMMDKIQHHHHNTNLQNVFWENVVLEHLCSTHQSRGAQNQCWCALKLFLYLTYTFHAIQHLQHHFNINGRKSLLIGRVQYFVFGSSGCRSNIPMMICHNTAWDEPWAVSYQNKHSLLSVKNN